MERGGCGARAPSPRPAPGCDSASATRWCERPGPAEGSAVRDGPLRSWHASQRRALVGAYRNGLPDGAWRSFYRSGELKFEAHYAAGQPVGEWRGWYRSGALSHRLLFLRGEIDSAESRSERGELLRREFYAEGLLHGPYVKQLPARDLRIYGSHRRGAVQGIERWYRNGQLEQWFSYCAGRLHGPPLRLLPLGTAAAGGPFPRRRAGRHLDLLRARWRRRRPQALHGPRSGVAAGALPECRGRTPRGTLGLPAGARPAGARSAGARPPGARVAGVAAPGAQPVTARST